MGFLLWCARPLEGWLLGNIARVGRRLHQLRCNRRPLFVLWVVYNLLVVPLWLVGRLEGVATVLRLLMAAGGFHPVI